MFVEITEIEQSFSLKDKQVTNYLVLSLANGKSLRVPVDEEATQYIIEASLLNGNSTEPQANAAGSALISSEPINAPSPLSVGPIEPLSEIFSQPKVKWAGLPDDQLSPFMKKLLLQSGTPLELSQEDLDSLVAKILEKMGKQAEAKATAPSLEFVDGPVVMRRPPMRTVPKDDDGYPIVGTSQGVDPGEVVERRDLDEDGVGQL